MRHALNVGANIDAVDFNRRSSLMHASMNGHLDVVKLLLEAGASVDTQDAAGRTALNAMVIDLLKELGLEE